MRLRLEARVPPPAVVTAGFGHAMSGMGAATIVGSNIHDPDRRGGRQGRLRPALAYGAVLLGLAFLVNALLTSVQQRGAGRARS